MAGPASSSETSRRWRTPSTRPAPWIPPCAGRRPGAGSPCAAMTERYFQVYRRLAGGAKSDEEWDADEPATVATGRAPPREMGRGRINSSTRSRPPTAVPARPRPHSHTVSRQPLAHNSSTLNPQPSTRITSAVDLDEVTTADALERIRPEWAALWARCPAATPFQSPEWLIPWWRHVGQGELWTLVVRSSGRLVGLVPLYIYSGSSVREVFPIGIATTDYLDALFEPGWESRGMAAVLPTCTRSGPGGTCATCSGCAPDRPCWRRRHPPGGAPPSTKRTCPVLECRLASCSYWRVGAWRRDRRLAGRVLLLR